MFGIQSIYWVLINSVVSFVYLFIISKILGKKQIAQLEFIDYAVGISLGSIAAQMSTDSDTPFYYYLIAMSVFFLLALFVAILGSIKSIAYLFYHSKHLGVKHFRKNYKKRFLSPKPVILFLSY